MTMTPTAYIANVNFHGHPLTVITGPNGEHLVAMKPICEAIGLQWEAQRKRIQRHDVLKSVASVMEATAADGKRYEYTCLPLDYLNGWLFGVESSRVKPEIRERLIQYQRECFAVLAAYWQVGEALNPRMPHSARIAPTIDLDYPASRWLASGPQRPQVGGPVFVTADMFFDLRSPTLALLGELRQAGYNVEACYMEVQGMRHHLEVTRDFLYGLRDRAQETLNGGVRFNRWR
jgi:hypothetical protein